MRVLVTGGAGFIGSHTCVELLNHGYEAIVVDNLCNAKPDVMDRIEKICGKRPTFYCQDVCDREAMREIFAKEKPDAVIHFAGLKAVGESCSIPLRYYRNNLDSTLSLLECMQEFGCKKIVFSSSATVYGPYNPSPYVESMPVNTATNPYGWTKVFIEQILRDFAAADSELSVVNLRYFNPIGAHESGLLGDDPDGIPNNLMPYIVRVAAGQLEKLTIFGDDYDTPDGSCIRDYLHVVDLAKGHLKALEYASKHCGVEAVNLGTGRGQSVFELVEAFEKASGVKVNRIVGGRREGDLPAIWADTSKAEALLGWTADKTVEEMCADSWNFVNHK
ncbi:MAG: UDP-glucose 4-epimerase GalE [Ruminococcaceae bacterium]|nr:UDP-glucose 4-epimerase GalE [Oscillospiraceae bacterium]